MPIYVDPLLPCLSNKNWPWTKSCHLFADTEAELHAFAGKIYLRRSWFQRNKRCDHYDLTERMRGVAVSFGAMELGRDATVAKWKEIQESVVK